MERTVWPGATCTSSTGLIASLSTSYDDFHFCEGEGFVFHSGHDGYGNLVLASPALVTTFVDSAFEKGIIDLDASSPWVADVAGFHRFTNLMQPGPCALKAEIDVSQQGQSRVTSFISADEENCPVPFDQRRPGPVHNCSSSERFLMSTLNML